MVATVSAVGSSHRREGGDWDTQLSREETKLGLESERSSEAPRKGSGSNLELQAPAPLLSGWGVFNSDPRERSAGNRLCKTQLKTA